MASDRRIDEIYDHADRLFRARKFDEYDAFLRSLFVNKLDVDEILAYLTASLPGKLHLPHRDEFYSRSEEVLRKRNKYNSEIIRGLQ